jgi:hypothetical protein
MSRAVPVSTEVFAAIWANRQVGEETEDAILRRLLKLPTERKLEAPKESQGGFTDARNGVHFPEGFEIFRTYKGKEFRALARNGAWVRTDSGRSYPSLNQLNSSIAAGAENVWNGNWKFREADGGIRSIGQLRR